MLGLGDAQLPAAHEDVHMSERLAAGQDYNLAEPVGECAIATNTAAAGGNASLMTIG
jgi:delta 1-pyrroline-5-carboxylate dehydrogenase